MTHLLLVDLETTGTDPAVNTVIEVAAVLYCTALAAPLASKAALVRAPANPAEPINRIPAAALNGSWCIDPAQVGALVQGVARLAPEPPIYVAHSAAFDRQWLPGIGEQWICSYADATWPRHPQETGSLVSIALAYDVGVVRAHRALEDCLTLAAVLTRVHEIEGGLDAWIARAVEPKIEIIACVSYDDRELAKRAGFGWEPARKVWTRRVGASRVETFRAGLPFPTDTVEVAATVATDRNTNEVIT